MRLYSNSKNILPKMNKIYKKKIVEIYLLNIIQHDPKSKICAYLPKIDKT